jgi:iron only hydrogenase large subunit-like protein
MYLDRRVERAKALYEEDEKKEIRKSHHNPEIKKLYEEFLRKPNQEISHKILHTHYERKTSYNLKNQDEYDNLKKSI